MKNEKFIIIILFLIFVALSGCINQDKGKLKELENEVQNLKEQISELKKQGFTPSPTSSQIDSVNLTNRTLSDKDVMPTPLPTFIQQEIFNKLPPNTLYVSNEMKPPVIWGDGKYELKAFRVTITNQQYSRLPIKAQIISGEQILEEKSIILEQAGSSYSFSNENQHFIYNTDIILRLWIQGYEPTDYMFKIVPRFD